MELEILKYKIMSNELKNNIKLSQKQNEAYNLMVNGKSIFLTGSAGTGKTQTIKMFINVYKQSKLIGVTSTTGISALLFGGVTLHSFLGIGLGQGSVESMNKKICSRPHLRKRWNELEILIIDEISMLSPVLFDKLEKLARRTRRNDKPFGGIQLILSGDFLQLPCINSDDFCFESEAWQNCVEHTVYLTEIMRQKDSEFQECLNNIRVGLIPKKTRKLLKSRVGVELKNDFGIKPTKLFSTNYSVDYINNKELDALAENDPDFFEYNMQITVYPGVKNRDFAIEKYKKNCNAAETIQLCEGAQVMLLYNMDTEGGLVNGSRGVVTGFVGDIPLVKFLNGRELLIDYHIWDTEENGQLILRVIQIPIKLAYALTIHKCVNENTLIYTENGIKRIKKISTDLFPEQKFEETKETSIGIIGKNGLKTATQIYKGIIEDTFVVTTSLGYRLEGSCRHPLLVYDGEEKWLKLPEIKIGDCLTLKIGSDCYGKNIKTESFLSDFSKKIRYNIPELVEEKLCYLIGLLIGDGCYSTKKDYPVELVVHKNIVGIKEKYVTYFEEIFGGKCNIYNYQKRKLWKLMVNSKHIREFLVWCGLDYVKGNDKTIPWVVLENNKESQISCLKGLFDSDGGVNKSCVHFTTTSYQLALDIQNVLLNLGIIASLKELNGDSKKTFNQSYRLHLTGYQAHLYYKFIGFEDVEKQRKLTEKYGIYKLNTVKSNICEIPNGDKLIKDFRGEIYKFYRVTERCNNLPKSYQKILSKIIHGKSKLRWQHIEMLCTGLTINIEEFGQCGKKLMYLYKNGIFFDKVVNIQKSKSQLYDLYVPEDHTFVGNGIINHNSQGCSLDYAEIDLSNTFEKGQAYVALSRVKNIEGLSIIEIDFDKIVANEKAIAFYKDNI
jgi:intein/homing endonuclease